MGGMGWFYFSILVDAFTACFQIRGGGGRIRSRCKNQLYHSFARCLDGKTFFALLFRKEKSTEVPQKGVKGEYGTES